MPVRPRAWSGSAWPRSRCARARRLNRDACWSERWTRRPARFAGWLPGRSQTEFGEALLRADRLDEAAPYLHRGYDQAVAAEGAKAGNTQSAARLLVKLFEKQGDAAAAAKWRAKQN